MTRRRPQDKDEDNTICLSDEKDNAEGDCLSDVTTHMSNNICGEGVCMLRTEIRYELKRCKRKSVREKRAGWWAFFPPQHLPRSSLAP